MKLLTTLALTAIITDAVWGFCVLDNKRGWWLDCGLRDSYLFRIADVGGVKANFDFGFGFGDDKGFPFSTGNTQDHHHHRRQDDESTLEPKNQQGGFQRRMNKPLQQLSPPPGTQIYKRQDDNTVGGPPLFVFGPKGRKVPIIIKQVVEPPQQQTQQQQQHFTLAPPIAKLLKVAPNTPADTDHVPSFAAKEMVVREAPKEYFPPDYPPGPTFHAQFTPAVTLPRTKFFCEEQKYHPGIYADELLGCKVFHLCIPASVGSRMTSYLCPNSTLFDQSILQCNWWFNVQCELSSNNYDANLALADSYRKINAAHIPLVATHDLDTLALLSPSQFKGRSIPNDVIT